MIVKVAVKCHPDGDDARELRNLLCWAQHDPDTEENPDLMAQFDELLGRVVQQAFDAGRRYQRENHTLEEE